MKNYIFTLSHSGGSPLELTHSPIGWNDKTITFTRNETYHSVMRSFSLSLKFIREGKDYINAAYLIDGVNALITIEVEVLDKSDYSYSTFYTGILDLSKMIKRRDDTECPIIDSDRLSKFKSRDETELSLNRLTTLDGGAFANFTNGLVKDFTIEGVDIKEQSYYDGVGITENNAYTTNDNVEYGVKTGADWDINEIGEDAVITDDSPGDYAIYTNNTGASVQVYWKITARVEGTITFANMTVSCTENIKVQSPIANIINQDFIRSTNGVENVDISGSGTSTTTVADGNSLTYKAIVDLSISGLPTITNNWTVTELEIILFKIDPADADTTPEMLLPDEALQRSIKIMTDDSAFRSDEVGRTDSYNHTYSSDGDLSLVGLGNGANIRGFNQSERPFKTTFKNLFKALFSIKPVGFWYSNDNSRWELNDIEEFYKTSEILSIGEVKDLEILVDESYYHNTIKAGYDVKLEYENINAAQNVSGTDYSNDVQRIANLLDLTTPYRVDDYGIELTRQKNYIDFYSEDIKADEDNFMIYGQRDGGDFITMQGYDNFDTITQSNGLVYADDTRLNLDLSPKRCMLRHEALLSIPMFITDGDVVHISSQFNFDLGLKKSGEGATIYEQDDISSLEEPLYYPEIYNFIAPVTTEQIDQLLTDPHGYITFTYEGETYKGYVIEVSTEPFNRTGNWTLIKLNENR